MRKEGKQSRMNEAERMSEPCERTSQQTSKWPSTHAPILDCFEPLCVGLLGLLTTCLTASHTHRRPGDDKDRYNGINVEVAILDFLGKNSRNLQHCRRR